MEYGRSLLEIGIQRAEGRQVGAGTTREERRGGMAPMVDAHRRVRVSLKIGGGGAGSEELIGEAWLHLDAVHECQPFDHWLDLAGPAKTGRVHLVAEMHIGRPAQASGFLAGKLQRPPHASALCPLFYPVVP